MSNPPLVAQITTMHDDEADGIDLSNPFRPTGPYGIAQACKAKIADLEQQRVSASPSQRKSIDRRIRVQRDLMNWCKSRAGFIEPDATDHSS